MRGRGTATGRFPAAPATARRSDPEHIPTTVQGGRLVDAALEDDARRRIARKAGKHAGVVQHVTVRFTEARTEPAGGVASRIGASHENHPTLVVEERAGDATIALRRAADDLGRTLQRALRHVGRGVPSRTTRRTSDPAPGTVDARDDDGSLYDRRVGHATANLERALARPEKRRRNALVDTSLPGVSASDRKAGQGATAARNTKRNTAGMTAALEDSRTRPSRKSTRRSTNRIKAATPKQRTTQLGVHDPKAAATRARAHRPATRS
jgi:hypothetical protein